MINILHEYIAKPRMVLGFLRFDGVFLAKTRISNSTVIEYKNKLYLEDNIFIGHYNFIEASAGITIKEGVQITNFVSITSHSSHNAIRVYAQHYIDFNNQHLVYQKSPIEIGAYTFVGPHSLILPGSKIGRGSLIHAYSLIKGEYPAFAIIQGNPAKVIGDTRKIDLAIIEKYPELAKFYQEWTAK